MQIMLENLEPNLPFTYTAGQKVVYKMTITGADVAYKKSKINKRMHNLYYQLENSEMIHQSQVITTL